MDMLSQNGYSKNRKSCQPKKNNRRFFKKVGVYIRFSTRAQQEQWYEKNN